jgi:hypothetical protein
VKGRSGIDSKRGIGYDTLYIGGIGREELAATDR